MRKIRSMIGMPVICREKKIGRMIQADISDDLRHMRGIWVDSGLLGTRYIPSEDLEMLGDIAIMADSRGVRKRLVPSGMFYRAISTDGQRLGAITGAEINELSFSVERLELSRGIWDDLLNGRTFAPQYTVNRETGEVIIENAEEETEVNHHEKRHGKGSDHRNADWRISGDNSGRYELADRKEMEHESPSDRQMDQPQGG